MASPTEKLRRGPLLVGASAVALVAALAAIWAFSPVSRTAAAPEARVAPLGAHLDTEIERGAYVARAADCAPCHTAPGGAPFAGGQILKTDFGSMASPNITPDPATGIGGWTRDEFARAVREGVAPHLGYLYPTMSFTSYTKMSDADIDALYAYIMSLPPVRAQKAEASLSFPYNVRLLLAGWRKLYFDNSEFRADPAKSDAVNRGAYLVQGPAHCAECHTPRTSLGALDAEHPLAGAAIDGYWAPNLTSDPETGIGRWSEDDLFAYLSGTGSTHGGAFGPMFDVVAQGTSHLTDDDRKAMAAYLHQLAPIKADHEAPLAGDTAHASIARGKLAYRANCAACHRDNGAGVPGLAPALAGHGALAAASENVIMPVLAGLSDRSGRIAMPAFQLDDQTVADIANYVRNAIAGSEPAAATAGQVAAARAKLH